MKKFSMEFTLEEWRIIWMMIDNSLSQTSSNLFNSEYYKSEVEISHKIYNRFFVEETS